MPISRPALKTRARTALHHHTGAEHALRVGVRKSQVGACSIHGAQTGRVFTTGPLGKSWHLTLKRDVECILVFQMHQNPASLYLYVRTYYRQANLPVCPDAFAFL